MKTIKELEIYLKNNFKTKGILATGDITQLISKRDLILKDINDNPVYNTKGETIPIEDPLSYMDRFMTFRYLKFSCVGFDDFTIHPSILKLPIVKIDEMLDGPTMANSILIEIKKAKTTYKIE